MHGETGCINRNLVALLSQMKDQPLAYNKDHQEDREALSETIDTLRSSP